MFQSLRVADSAARTTTGTSTAVALNVNSQVSPGGALLGLLVNVTAASGTTPTLDLTVEWSSDGTNFVVGQPADALTQITTAVGAAKQFAIKAPFYRVKWTIAGTTPSFTFDVVTTVV